MRKALFSAIESLGADVACIRLNAQSRSVDCRRSLLSLPFAECSPKLV
jgi:hypothetical protein